MRFYLTFELEKSSLPKDYRRIILSYIKKSLTEILDGRYYSQYFKDNIQKDFCFSLKLPKAKFTKDEIIEYLFKGNKVICGGESYEK